MRGKDDHFYMFGGKKLLPCPFCGNEPIVDSCDRLISIGCEKCKYRLPFHGLVQSEIVTDVVVSWKPNTKEPAEWYDKDAYQRALYGWNRRSNDGE